MDKEQIVENIMCSDEMSTIIPAISILSGSRAYGLHSEISDWDVLGIHLMDSWQCLEHPKFRKDTNVIDIKFDRDFNRIDLSLESEVSYTSFELWKFIELYLAGSTQVYELLFLPAIYEDYKWIKIADLLRQGLTSKYYYVVKNIILKYAKEKNASDKDKLMIYYRYLQCTKFLQDEEFVWEANKLFTDEAHENILAHYLGTRKFVLGKEETAKDIANMLDKLDVAYQQTKLPESCPKEVISEVLDITRNVRASFI